MSTRTTGSASPTPKRADARASTRRRRERAVPAKTQPVHEDAWLDSLEKAPKRHGWREGLRRSVGGTTRWFGDLWDFLTTTVGRILVMMLVLTALLFAAGYSMYQAGSQREANLARVVTNTEPMSNAAHTLYMSLSSADTLATSLFVQPGLQTDATTSSYIAALDQATIAADEVQRGASGTESAQSDDIQTLVLDIKRQLPFYISQMERAQTNQRMGNPVGVSYMTSASTLMRDNLLASAREVLDLTRAQVNDDMKRYSSPQRAPITGMVVAIVGLIICQWLLWRRFHRRFNKGFLVATVLMVIALGWVGAANYSTWEAGSHDFKREAEPLSALIDARIAAQTARTNETLFLLRRETLTTESSGPAGSFVDTEAQIRNALDKVTRDESQYTVSQARTSLDQWREAHTQLVDALERGDYERAVELAESSTNARPEDVSASDAFRRLDSSLSTLVEASRADVQTNISEGQNASRTVPTGVMVLVLLSIAAVWLGIRSRIQEYM